MRRAFLSPTQAIAALLLVLCLVPACSANLVELLYVNGCEDEAAPLRGTRGCFAGSFHDPTAMVVLTLRGLHVPSPTTTSLRVVLVLHTPPPLPHMQDALHAPTTSVLEAGHVWECLNLTASNLFPTELFTCQLPSPAAAGISTQMKMNEHDSTWFDVQLFASASSQRYWSGEKRAPTNFELIANLRRSVEVKMASPHGETNTKKKKPASLQHHPLENLLDASGHVSGMMLGIGGLHDVLEQLYRRAFLTRLPSLHTITNQLELQHVRGVLLHGPPGNGKSLVARGLVQLLRDEANVRTTVINAADVLSKYVGESEKNLKAVFDEEMANDGDGDEVGPRMHIIVIDEFEALFRRRGYSNDESSAKAVYDGITNMLLSLMDGVDPRNDVLLIGMTNRLDSIDKALLRPGRFEVLLEVPVPDVKAREEIFFIHTQQLRQNAMLPADDWIPRLATQCDGFSGSDIAGVVRSATSYALQRYREVQQHSPSGQHAAPSFMVELQDLERAVVEIHATRAEASQRGLEDVGIVYPDLIDYNEMLMEAMRRVSSAMDRMRRSQHTNVLSLAVVGGQGTGKTFVAHHMLQLLQMIPTKRYISCRRLVEEVRDPAEMVDTVRDALQDASRGAFGAVVLDDLDVLLDHLRSVGHHEATLLHAIYRYTSDPPSGRQHPLDQHADARHDDHGKRVLIWTANSLGALYPLTADVQVPLRTVPRSGVRRVLEAIGLLPKDNRELTQAALRFFPSTLSIRDVLRITDMAVLKLTEDLPSSGEEGADSWRLPFFSGNRTNTSSITTSSTPVVSSLGRARAFAAAVDDVLQEMHIQDLDRFSRMSSTKGSYDEGGEEGEAAEMLW